VQGRSVESLRRRVRRLVERVRGAAQRRRRRALDSRGVHGSALSDGMGGVWASMPAGAQVLLLTSLRRLAALAVVPGDPRTEDQRMSDVLAALPPLVLSMAQGRLGGAVQQALADAGIRPERPGAAPVQAVLLVPAATALGAGHEPGELVGHGPVSAEHARALLRSATVRTGTVDPTTGRLVGLSTQHTDLRATARPAPATGLAGLLQPVLDEAPDEPREEPAASDTLTRAVTAHLAAHGPATVTPAGTEPQYRPSARLRRFLDTRDTTCIGPGCSVPASRCDTEHLNPWPHGPTSPHNLSPVSRRCHRAKNAGWRYTRAPDGTTTWHPPGSRRTYVVAPETPLVPVGGL